MRRSLAALLVLATAGCVETSGGEGAGGGGGAGGAGGAGGGCVDRSASGECRESGADDPCGVGRLCSVQQRSCSFDRCCTLPFACIDALASLAPGGTRCEDDGACASGVCVPLEDGGLCLHPCSSDSSCPPGLGCRVVPLAEGVTVRSCVGVEEERPSARAGRCADDRDCPDGRVCRIVDGERLYEGLAGGVCAAPTGDARVGAACDPTLLRADAPVVPESLSGLCEDRGACIEACPESNVPSCLCKDEPPLPGLCRELRCTRPCVADADCPSPFACRAYIIDADSRLGTADFSFCQAPNDEQSTEWFCWDEQDCCIGGLTRLGGECCRTARGGCREPPLDRTHCALVTLPGGRWTSRCEVPTDAAGLTRRAPGEACATDAECTSRLCVEQQCSSPCDANGVDRCGEILAGTQCCPTRIGEACVPVCRTDCATAEACTP